MFIFKLFPTTLSQHTYNLTYQALLLATAQDDLNNVQEIANQLGWAALWGKGGGGDSALAAPDYTATKWPLGIGCTWLGGLCTF